MNDIFHFNRPMQASVRITKGPVNTPASMKQILNLGIRNAVLCTCCVNEVISGYISSYLQT